MGTIVLAGVPELETVKISELPEIATVSELGVIPGVEGEVAYKTTKASFLRFLKTEYDELSDWLAGGVTLGSDGGANSPLIYTGANKIDIAVYACALNATWNAADYNNLISSPNNTISAEINF